MAANNPISTLTIRGFRSFKQLDKFQLSSGLNVLIGGNGSGKSNLIGFFRLLYEMVEQRLGVATGKIGGADRLLYRGRKETKEIVAVLGFGLNGYWFTLEPTADDRFIFTHEIAHFQGIHYGPKNISMGSGHAEAKLRERHAKSKPNDVIDYVYTAISNWRVYHFHDTSDTAAMKRPSPAHDFEMLRPDASNLAAFLAHMKETEAETLDLITRTIRLVVPTLREFRFAEKDANGEKMTQLLWLERDHDYPLHLSQLSDGSLRFICLATALLQPTPPATIIIDEPELGLHPAAILLLASLFKQAATRTQVIASTQSPLLLNQLKPDDIIVVDREDGATVLKRLDSEKLSEWLSEFAIGELWQKNLIGGRPSR
jgi:predicted ATPase